MKTQLKGMMLVMGMAALMSACGEGGMQAGTGGGGKGGGGGGCNHDCCGYSAAAVAKCVIVGPKLDPIPEPAPQPEPKVDSGLPPVISGAPDTPLIIPAGGQMKVGPLTVQSEVGLKAVKITCDEPFLAATPDQVFDPATQAKSYAFSLTAVHHQAKPTTASLCHIQAFDQLDQASKLEVVAVVAPQTVQLDAPSSIPVKTGGSQAVIVSASFSSTAQQDEMTLRCSQPFGLAEYSVTAPSTPLGQGQTAYHLSYSKKLFEENTRHYLMSFATVADTIHCKLSGTGDDGSSSEASFDVIPTPNAAPLYVTPVIDDGKSIIAEIPVKPASRNSISNVRLHSDVGLDKVTFSCAEPTVTAIPSHAFEKWPNSWGMHYNLDYYFDLTVKADAAAPASDTTCAISATDILGQTKVWRVVVHTS